MFHHFPCGKHGGLNDKRRIGNDFRIAVYAGGKRTAGAGGGDMSGNVLQKKRQTLCDVGGNHRGIYGCDEEYAQAAAGFSGYHEARRQQRTYGIREKQEKYDLL